MYVCFKPSARQISASDRNANRGTQPVVAGYEATPLNLEQVRALNLPPNPAKESDARFVQYVEETGAAECWELDALSPTIIDTLLDRAIRELVDRPAWRRALAQEEEDPARLAAIADDFDGTEGEP
jgi:hypothetical protein